ncbi:hypothetical protein EDC04DRAFT_2597653 [Pisolithus marmoratus]|nr:hypothetical protein EDC04DRAFT_2597653 [Pisolithus marmoratus]
MTCGWERKNHESLAYYPLQLRTSLCRSCGGVEREDDFAIMIEGLDGKHDFQGGLTRGPAQNVGVWGTRLACFSMGYIYQAACYNPSLLRSGQKTSIQTSAAGASPATVRKRRLSIVGTQQYNNPPPLACADTLEQAERRECRAVTITELQYSHRLPKTAPIRELDVAMLASVFGGFGVVALFCSVGVHRSIRARRWSIIHSPAVPARHGLVASVGMQSIGLQGIAYVCKIVDPSSALRI